MTMVKKAEPEQDLCSWLNSCKGIRNAQPVLLEIHLPSGKVLKTCGALYEHHSGDPLPGSKAALEPEKYPVKWEPRLYALIDWPKYLAEVRRRKNRHESVCWKFCWAHEEFGKQEDQRDWYCAGWSPTEPIEEKYREFHPFGPWTGFHAWDVPDGTSIDQYEPKPYLRLEMRVSKEK